MLTQKLGKKTLLRMKECGRSAELIINTSNTNIYELREQIRDRVAQREPESNPCLEIPQPQDSHPPLHAVVG